MKWHKLSLPGLRPVLGQSPLAEPVRYALWHWHTHWLWLRLLLTQQSYLAYARAQIARFGSAKRW